MENAMQFFDELREKYKHQVEQAIEDWDYQDFSPDKRCALLDEEITADDGDIRPVSTTEESSPQRMSWSGLSPDDELADYDYGADGSSADLGLEGKLVALSTPPGGIQGMPDADGLQRLLAYAPRLEAPRLAAALVARLQHPNAETCWQVRAKVLVVMQLLVESKPLAARFLPSFRADTHLMRHLDGLRTADRNNTVRESARKLMSLIGSGGADPMLIPREPSPSKPHIRHHQVMSATKKVVGDQQKVSSVTKKLAGVPVKKSPAKPTMKVNTAVAMDKASGGNGFQQVSPKIARAAMASWRRRSMNPRPAEPSNLMPFQQPTLWGSGEVFKPSSTMNPPAAPAITTSGNASRYQSGQISAFTFIR